MVFRLENVRYDTADMIGVDNAADPYDRGLYVTADFSCVFVSLMTYEGLTMTRIKGEQLMTLAKKIGHPALMSAAAREAGEELGVRLPISRESPRA